MKTKHHYTPQFFKKLLRGSKDSAAQTVPLLLDILRPASVVDVGCGTAAWLLEFCKRGVDDVLGIDGEHIPEHLLKIPVSQFLSVDLTCGFELDRKFDLVLSLEVAEHLPEKSSERFVDSLARLGDVILFSAAIPDQGGEGHMNEQWPEYWIDRFIRRGYRVSTCIRDAIWSNDEVEWWYAQNILLFYRVEALNECPAPQKIVAPDFDSKFSLVHPRHYLHIKWVQRVLESALDIVDVIPQGNSFVLIDNDQMGHEFEPKRHVIRLPENENWYWETPPDEDSAINAVKNLKSNGASHLVIAWPAYWWLDQRPILRRYLMSEFLLLLQNDRVLLFEL
ncbi:class I SAM-dependent methyltransferase [Pseudomonadota bacterium]